MNQLRTKLDQLFAFDAATSVLLGLFALLAPHGIWTTLLSNQMYSHSVHETLRLYGCLKLACGWILWHIRRVDDGLFRRHVCEALFVCYTLQAFAVTRAQFTDAINRPISLWYINWMAIGLMLALAGCYASFRFGKGGNLIKLYELPTSNTLQ